ncbi:MAG TPA: squalene--hopene cyclase [Candidatus Limnocylindrales bacterium]|jgi:squalene-hopene/tetraprenyl-beta-curcumene cyclase|nr:squalene--hopene cyclase [Candidatus Limnocylindrales bacterium]
MAEALPPNPGEMRFGKLDDIKARVAAAIDASRKYMFSLQHPEEGYWCGELGADTTLESDYVLLHRLLGTENPERTQKCANEILSHQNEDGGWPIFNGGPSNISASVKAYFALKMAGHSHEHPALAKARERILVMGGVTEVNTFTKIYLCFLGQYDYDAVPAIPPEITLFPNWFWFNIYEISSWSRAILVPLSIAYAKKPFKKIPDEEGIEELFVGGRGKQNLRLKWDKKLVSWRNFFLLLDRLVHFFEKVHIRPLRSIALKKAERWMLERLEMSDGLGAIYPGIMNSIIALRCLGYSLDDPQVIRAMDEFERLGIEEETTFRMQPCMSPVWDTALAVFALADSGVSPTDHRLVLPSEWMLKKQVTRKGDWCVKNPKAEPAGWYFEFNNEFYPDVDDTAMVMLALGKVKTSNENYQDKSVQRALDWVLSMQCKNGGWASFDKDNDRMVFQYVPFADHNAMLDPATVDITGRVLESLAAYGYSMKDEPVRRALEFIKREQEPDGSWFGRWGVNYIYGTMLVLRGLEAVGMDHHEPCVQQAAEWLRMMQNPDGGWGETCGSYDDPNTKGVGPSTASQTAWAVMGLLAANDTRSDSLQLGIGYLLKTQLRDGSWSEAWYTGTGFPRVFYLMYHMYRQYFPLIALTAYAKASAASQEEQLRITRTDRRTS